jgi:alpha-D-glucose phosphate-specific phosphoglucomutase
MGGIHFGTDGWRARIADEFTFANVRLMAQAIAQYVPDTGRGLVIGYDHRFQSEHFAATVAEVLAGNGISTWLTAAAAPTPAVAYAVRDMGTAGAVMITAGHNAPEYNGIRFITEHAGPAIPEITQAIEAHRDRLTDADVKLMPLEAAQERGLVRLFDPKPAYLGRLHNNLKYSTIYRGQLRVVIDPLWGAGTGYLEDLLREGSSKIDVIHGSRDVLCGGQLAEPAEAGLADLKRAVIQNQADLGLALDGDAGRFGVIDRDGSFINPNEVICMLLYYLTEYRNWRGAVARTEATTRMIDRIAEDYGLPVVETPVGFKYIGQSLIKHRSILGGEESGGLGVQGHIPEKDGILALAMVMEMASFRDKPLRAYQEEIQQKHGALVSGRLDLRLPPEAVDGCLERMHRWAPRDLAGQCVLERSNWDGVKLVLEDASWVLVRPSGTESLFRIYAEAPDPERLYVLQISARQAVGI